MAVISLPVEPSTLYITQQRRRAAQESAFTGAIQHVAGEGAIFNGYIDLPPIIDRSVWSACREVLRKVMDGTDRLRIPLFDGNTNFDISFPTTNLPPGIDLAEMMCTLDSAAWLRKDGKVMRIYNPFLEHAHNPPFQGTVVTPSGDSRPNGMWMTVLWHDNAPVVRAALTQTTVITYIPTSQDDADWRGLPDEADHAYTERTDITFNSGSFANFSLFPAIPHMFRQSSSSGNWSIVQAQYCEPFMAAVVLNDDAIGHTISDRALVPNRIEFASSNVWG